MAAGMPVDKTYLWNIFTKIDKDGNGSISADELQLALSNGAWTPFNPETVRLMIGMFDRDNSGAIEFNEFFALWQYVTDWQKTFRSYDQDNSGTIDRQELKIALTNFGYRLSERMYTLLITKFDRAGGGSINFDDFIQCCIILQILTNSFRCRDQNRNGWITIGYEEFVSMVFSLNVSK
ncbi:Programmed cell death protein 6 [Desmophyllum pertusum]|uniref:Programmed cell death protein 6 n=1 Tax=Desmophyllum pertusum TaxID=174260 RepID=A0A9W9YEE9_9CNID|nr:Programmed cell death protein 6 [Desmophyllum pertusum]